MDIEIRRSGLSASSGCFMRYELAHDRLPRNGMEDMLKKRTRTRKTSGSNMNKAPIPDQRCEPWKARSTEASSPRQA